MSEVNNTILLSTEQQRNIIAGRQTVILTVYPIDDGEYTAQDINGESLDAIVIRGCTGPVYWSKITPERQQAIAECYGYDSLPAFRGSAKRLGLEKLIEDLRPFYVCDIEPSVASLPTLDEPAPSLESEVAEVAKNASFRTSDCAINYNGQTADMDSPEAMSMLEQIVRATIAEAQGEPATVAFGLPDREYSAQITGIGVKINGDIQVASLTIQIDVTPEDLADNGLQSAAFAVDADGTRTPTAGESVKLLPERTAGYSLLIAPSIGGEPGAWTEYVPAKLTLGSIEPHSGTHAALQFKASGLPYDVAGQRWTGGWLLQFIAKPITAESQVDDRQTSIEDFTDEEVA